jgi:anti-anti-sigma factor
MPIERWSDNVVVVHLADDPQFTEDLQTLHSLCESIGVHAVLDFACVHFINSSTLARLLKLRTRAHSTDARLILCNLSTQVWGTFLVTGLDKVFDFSDNVTTSLATLQIA